MANSKPATDPLTTIEAMWRGSITRLGQFFKDYKEYGPQTRTVLRGTSGKYRDALDDLEIELLDVKWLLEQDLRVVRTKRDALKKAATTPAPVKRKLDAIAEKQATTDNQQRPAKRQKSDGKLNLSNSQIQERDFAEEAPSRPPEDVAAEPANKSSTATVTDMQPSTTEKPLESGTKDPGAMPASGVSPGPTEVSTQPLGGQASEVEKSTTAEAALSEAPISADANDMSLESIFGSPTTGENGANEFDLNIDITGDPSATDTLLGPSDENRNAAEDPASLNTLLPGLDAYANATNDNFTMLDTTQDDNDLADSGLMSQQTADGNAFALPTLDDTNIFDTFLNSNEFQAPPDSEQKKDDPLNDDSMLNISDLDDGWFD